MSDGATGDTRDPTEITSASIAYVNRRVSQGLGALAVASVAGPVAVFFVASLTSYPEVAQRMLGNLGPVSEFAGIAAVLGILVRAFPLSSPGILRRERNGTAMHVDFATRLVGRKHLALPAVRSGCVVPDGVRARAELDLRNGDLLHVDAPNVATAIEVLRVAGVDAAKQHARFRVDDLMSRTFAYMMTASVLGFVTLPLAFRFGPVIWFVCAAALLAALVGFVTLPEINVGTDGIAYKRGPFRYFIPLSQIKEVRSSDVTLSVHLRDGRVKTIRSLTGADPGRAYSLELRVREALAASRGEHASTQLEVLERRGRSVADWTVSLAGLTRAGSSYRAVGLSAEDLDAIVASPDVGPERRIGAALALHGAGDPTAGDRIRVAAAQCASARLRVALERVGEGAVDVEAITEALAETEAFAQEAEAAARVRTPSS